MKLDLGATKYEAAIPSAKGWTSIALDDTDKGIIGNYNRMPYPDNTFTYAYGGCYLEETVDFTELFRVLKPGAIAKLFACMRLFADYQIVVMMAKAAGFKIRRHLKFGWDGEDGKQNPENYTTEVPMIIQKPY